jgi:CheY-like chemotaxis protein
MMPGMDGIETVKAIRALKGEYFQKLPVVVLTANAIAGMRDMFLAVGFNDYISKPIEIAKLDKIIALWIPAEKRIKSGKSIKRKTFNGETGIVIPGVDVKQGVNMTGGTVEGYKKVLSMFRKDVRERLVLLQEPPDEAGLPLFVTQVHALKSVSAALGAKTVSEEATALEAAGKGALAGSATDRAAIAEGLPQFREHLTGLIEGIGSVLEEKRGGESGEAPAGNGEAAFDLLSDLQAALDAKNMKETDRLLEEIEQLPLGTETQEAINAVSDKVLMGEYAEAVETINAIIGKKGN